jgi:23S rRNA (adenine2503-C2)-methyltransferase
VPFSTLTLEHEAQSRDGTVKALFHTTTAAGRGGADALPRRPPLALRLLAVRLPADLHVLRDRQMKFGRNLTASEILDQALHFRRIEPSTTSSSWAWASR